MYLELHDHPAAGVDFPDTGSGLAASRDLLAVIDRQCLIRSTTEAFAGLLGCEKQDLIDQFYGHFITLVDLDTRQHLRFKHDLDPVIRCLNKAEGCLKAAAFLPGTEAGRPVLTGTLAPMFGPDGSVTGCLFVASHAPEEDISFRISGQRHDDSWVTDSGHGVGCIRVEATGEINHEHRL